MKDKKAKQELVRILDAFNIQVYLFYIKIVPTGLNIDLFFCRLIILSQF